MKIDRKTYDELVQILTPHLTGYGRESLVYSAFHGSHITETIDFGGSEQEFAHHLIQAAIRYGEMETGEPAILALLDEISNYVGVERKIQLEAIRQELESENIASETEIDKDIERIQSDVQRLSEIQSTIANELSEQSNFRKRLGLVSPSQQMLGVLLVSLLLISIIWFAMTLRAEALVSVLMICAALISSLSTMVISRERKN